jgi:tight adherence protein B
VSGTVLLVTGLAAVAGAVLLIALAALPAGARRVPLSRLDPTLAPPASALAGAGAAAGAVVGRALVRGGRLSSGTALLERAGVAVALPDLVLLVGLGTVVGGILAAVVGGLLLGALVVVLVPLGARMVLSWKVSRRQAAFADQLDDSLQLMASSMRAGHSLMRALDSVSQEADSPTAEEFARVVNETRVGRDLTDSLDELAARMESDDFSWISQAIAIHREVGGNLAEVLDAVGSTIRERNALRRQVKALAAEGKLSAIVLMALPFVVTVFLLLVQPTFISKFTASGLGWAMLVAAGLLLVVGGFWLKKMVSIRF